MTSPSLSRSTIGLLSARLVSRLSFSLLLFLAGRLLATSDFAVLAIGLAYSSLVLSLSDLGLTQIVIREMAKDRLSMNVLISNGAVLKLLLVLASSISIALLSQYVYGGQTAPIVTFFILAAAMQSISSLFRAVFYASEKFVYEILALVFEKMLLAVVGVSLIILEFPIVYLAMAFVGAGIITIAYSMVVSHFKLGLGLQRAFVKRHHIRDLTRLLGSLSIVVLLASVHQNYPTIALSILGGENEVSMFSAPLFFIQAASFLFLTASNVLLPRVSRLYSSKPQYVSRIVLRFSRYILALGMLGLVSVIAVGQEVLVFVYGVSYADSFPILMVLAFQLPLFLSYINNSTLFATGNVNALVSGRLAVLIIDMSVGLLMIWVLGGYGAALAIILTELVMFVWTSYKLSSIGINTIDITSTAKLVGITVLTLIVLHLLKSYNPLVNITILLLLCGVFVLASFLLDILPREDLKNVLIKLTARSE